MKGKKRVKNAVRPADFKIRFSGFSMNRSFGGCIRISGAGEYQFFEPGVLSAFRVIADPNRRRVRRLSLTRSEQERVERTLAWLELVDGICMELGFDAEIGRPESLLIRPDLRCLDDLTDFLEQEYLRLSAGLAKRNKG
ncbi:MAG: hypothetical protein WC959_05495 [Kiritimatiellales bacterium]